MAQITPTRRELLDSREPYDAGLLGYDGPRDPRDDAEGLILSVERGCIGAPWFYLQTSQGESAPISHAAARIVAEDILKYLAHHTAPANSSVAPPANDQVAA